MPSASGVYSLPTGYLAVTGTTIQASQHNPPLEDIAAALTGRLSRDGSAPMTGALQLASGTVTAPGLVFAVDPSSGLSKTTNGIGVDIGGVQVAEFTAAGLASGARLIGELVPYTCTAAPSAVWVLPFGQTLSRTTYAALWAQAQIEITNGNTFYNNGDGSTTFGIGDMRGRTWAAIDNMGGTDAARLSNAASSIATVRTTLGGTGGAVVHALSVTEMPSHYHTAGIYDPGHAHTINYDGGQSTDTAAPQGGPQYAVVNTTQMSTNPAATGVRVNSNNGLDQTYSQGGSAAHDNMQPTMLGNWLLFAGGLAA